jgi:hypothetical protein
MRSYLIIYIVHSDGKLQLLTLFNDGTKGSIARWKGTIYLSIFIIQTPSMKKREPFDHDFYQSFYIQIVYLYFFL